MNTHHAAAVRGVVAVAFGMLGVVTMLHNLCLHSELV